MKNYGSFEELSIEYGIHDVSIWLAEYLPHQRWSGGGGHRITEVYIEDAGVFFDNSELKILLIIAGVAYPDGQEEFYNVPLGIRNSNDPWFIHTSPDVIIGRFFHHDQHWHAYDALTDPACALEFWKAIVEKRTFSTIKGKVVSESEAINLASSSPEMIRPIGRDQTNTLLVRNQQDLLKCLRRIDISLIPSLELEMTNALWQANFHNIAKPIGVMQYNLPDNNLATLNIIQPYLRNGTEGWALALTSLRDFYATAEESAGGNGLHRSEQAVTERGGNFAAEAFRLGQVTGEMHKALASDQIKDSAIHAIPVTAEVLGQWFNDMLTDLDRVLNNDDDRLDVLRENREVFVSSLERIRNIKNPGLAIRMHGDYHLGQVLRNNQGWIILDFEGEPGRPVEARRIKASPLRDVAGMLRSFDYAAAAALAERLDPEDPSWESLLLHGDVWAATNRKAFWKGYWQKAEKANFLPEEKDVYILCQALEVQKATYELVYELGHRPTWAGIPLRFLVKYLEEHGVKAKA